MGGRGVQMLAAGVCALLAAPAVAAAEDRYASPTGTGLEPCLATEPCDIDLAVEGAGAGAGDVVKLLPGVHAPDPATGGSDRALSITVPLTIEPADPATRPRIAAAGVTTVFSGPGVTIRGVNITGATPPGAVLHMQAAGVVERVHVSISTGQMAILAREGAVVRDSVARSVGDSGVGIYTGGSGATLDNVTAIGGFRGISVDSSYGATQTVAITNTIAAGGAAGDDIFVRQAAGTSITATIDHSNYDDLVDVGTTAIETAPQAAPPDFFAPGIGDFHQLATSPTVDAGAVQASTGGRRDLDGELRWLGSAPDIGADEFTEAPPPDPVGPGALPNPDTFAPETRITGAPKPKMQTRKRRAKVRIAFASEPAATFSCRLDGRSAVPCSSPFKAKVKKGRHTFAVGAVDASGNADPTPASVRWKVKRKRR
jgi:hypothetical protein